MFERNRKERDSLGDTLVVRLDPYRRAGARALPRGGHDLTPAQAAYIRLCEALSAQAM